MSFPYALGSALISVKTEAPMAAASRHTLRTTTRRLDMREHPKSLVRGVPGMSRSVFDHRGTTTAPLLPKCACENCPVAISGSRSLAGSRVLRLLPCPFVAEHQGCERHVDQAHHGNGSGNRLLRLDLDAARRAA